MAGINEAQVLELRRDLMALNSRASELERRQGLGSSQWLAGGGLCPFFYFNDGTWVDEDDPTAPQYAVQQTTYHGNPGVKLEYQDPGPASATERRIILRLETPVTVSTADSAVFNFFIGSVIATAIPGATGQNSLLLEVGLLTVSLTDAILQNMSWDIQPTPVEVFTVGKEITFPDESGRYNDDGGEGPLIGNRFTPASQRIITGVVLRFKHPPGSSLDSTGRANIRRTRVGDPQRSFLFVE